MPHITLSLLVLCALGGARSLATDVILDGAGATFPQPLYARWIAAYQAAHGVRVSYRAVGSSAGVRLLRQRAIDFGATDAYLADEELADAGADLLHVPTCLGAVAITYNVPIDQPLRCTPDLLADILLGQVTRWADDRIAACNPELVLPEQEITVVHRSDGSGTTFILTDYLAKVSHRWRSRVGRGQRVTWPAGIGVEGNGGVATFVRRIPGSIGYVELAYAAERQLPVAAIRNRHGNFVVPTRASVTAAAQVALPADARVMLTDTSVPDGYPISGFTYLILYREQRYAGRPRAKAHALARFLWWVLHEGQDLAAQSPYPSLPAAARQRAAALVDSLQYGGQPLVDW